MAIGKQHEPREPTMMRTKLNLTRRQRSYEDKMPVCGRRMRILVVEDDKKTASFVTRGLIEAGFAVDHVEDGENGLEQALSGTYDAIIMD
jgi:CheY-like chemotaxis protein